MIAVITLRVQSGSASKLLENVLAASNIVVGLPLGVVVSYGVLINCASILCFEVDSSTLIYDAQSLDKQ